jgi:hypothetical protein
MGRQPPPGWLDERRRSSARVTAATSERVAHWLGRVLDSYPRSPAVPDTRSCRLAHCLYPLAHHPKGLKPVVPTAAKIAIAPSAAPSPSLSTSKRPANSFTWPSAHSTGMSAARSFTRGACIAPWKPAQCRARSTSGTMRSRLWPTAAAALCPNSTSAPRLHHVMMPSASATTMAVPSRHLSCTAAERSCATSGSAAST